MTTPAEIEYHRMVNAGISQTLESSGSSTRSSSLSDISRDESIAFKDQSPSKSSRAAHTPVNMPTATYLSNTTQFDANTGPKGVIADALSFESARKRTLRQTLHAFTDGSPFRRLNAASREKTKSPSPEVQTDGEDDDFMKSWRQERLNELASMKQDIRTRRQSPSKRRYGDLLTVDPAGYLDAVEKVAADTVVLVLIYDDEFPLSNQIEDCLRSLCHKYLTTRFVRLQFEDAEMNEIAAPGILAYRGGECFANLISFASELPRDKEISVSTVEAVLQRHKIL